MGELEVCLPLLRSLHSRLRRVAALGLALLVIVCADWLFQHEHLRQRAQLIEKVLVDLASEEQFRNEVRDVARKRKSNFSPLPLESFPRLNAAVQKQVLKQLPPKQYQLGPFKLPTVIYRYALMVAPIGLVLVSLCTLLQIRKLHLVWGPLVKDGSELQQVLNSPLFDRVTSSYGEGRTIHFIMVALMHSPLVLSALMYIPAVLLPEVEPVKLFVTSLGTYFPSLPIGIDVTQGRTDQFVNELVSVLGITTIGWLLISALATKQWYKPSASPSEE